MVLNNIRHQPRSEQNGYLWYYGVIYQKSAQKRAEWVFMVLWCYISDISPEEGRMGIHGIMVLYIRNQPRSGQNGYSWYYGVIYQKSTQRWAEWVFMVLCCYISKISPEVGGMGIFVIMVSYNIRQRDIMYTYNYYRWWPIYVK